MKPIELPRFRYLQDVTRFLEEMEKDVDENGRLIKRQQQLLASSTAKVNEKLTAATVTVFNITPSDVKEQKSLVRRLKHKIDPELTQVVVPQMKKLESQYNMAEDLYAKLRVIETAETQIKMQFPNRQGPEYDALMRQMVVVKDKIQEQLKLCLGFLSEVANKHVPKQFQKYTTMIAELVNEHVIFKESHTFLYVSVSPEGDLVFTSYLMLQDVANDEGFTAPHLYVSVQWVLSKKPTISVDLSHEYEVPNNLLGQGEMVGEVGEAVKAISDLLELENFSSALGVVPLALQLNVDPTTIKPSMFSYRDVIAKMHVGERTWSFTLRKEITNPVTVAEIAATFYKELKALMKRGNVALSMRTDPKKGNLGPTLVFNIVRLSEGGEFSDYEYEFLRDKFGLNQTQLRKIGNIINRGN